MRRAYFGTDGIRGVANEKLTPELAFRLGQAAGRRIDTPWVVIGRDTRRSGPMLGAALASGFCSVGVDVITLGVVPTPTVSHVVRGGGFGLGCVISASHNPAPDNGIKLFGPDGGKLPDALELAIEGLIDEPPADRPTGRAVGMLLADRSGVDAYLDFLVSLVPERLDGMRVALDCAHGAAFELAPEVLRRLGAEVVLTGAEPDGNNINAEGGATKPETVQSLTVERGCHVGVAFDGDADRAVFSDEMGQLINGDRTIGAWAAHWQSEGMLEPPVVVGTVMSNMGFEAYLASLGIKLERAPVGDKYVSERIRATGARVGGEQSGHIIFPQHGPTGDGLATMLEFLRVLRDRECLASAVTAAYENWPQLLVNVEVESRDTWNEGPLVRATLAEAEEALQGYGRLNVRASGTQPMIRVMVEAEDSALRDAWANRIVDAMAQEARGKVYSRVDLTHALGD